MRGPEAQERLEESRARWKARLAQIPGAIEFLQRQPVNKRSDVMRDVAERKKTTYYCVCPIPRVDAWGQCVVCGRKPFELMRVR